MEKIKKELDQYVKEGKLTEEEKKRLLTAQKWMRGMNKIYESINKEYNA